MSLAVWSLAVALVCAVPSSVPVEEKTPETAAAQQFLSQFFRSDDTANAILAGKKTKDINEVGLILGTFTNANTSTFGYRVVSGYKQIGYTFPYYTSVGDKPQQIIQNRFQARNGLPIGTTITKDLLLRLDQQVAARETLDRALGPTFPLYLKLISPPRNEPSNDHLAAIYAVCFGSLPPAIAPWTEENFRYAFLVQRTGTIEMLPGGGYVACDGFYDEELDDSCGIRSSQIPIWNDDIALASVLLHEYAHFIDGSLYSAQAGSAIGAVNTMSYLNISFDTSDKIVSIYTYYRRRAGATVADFISGYGAESGALVTAPGYYTGLEDFAEAFAAYVLEGQPFRELAATAPILAQKYEWLKQNVFGGVEFASGNPGYAQFYSGNNRPGNEIDLSRADPSFIWDYRLPQVSVPQALDYFILTPCRVVDTRNPIGSEGGPALTAGNTRDFLLTSSCSIPATARALAANVTVTQPSALGYLTIFAAGTVNPQTSTISYGVGQTRANNAVIALSPSGAVSVNCNQPSGTVHFVLDVNGYFE